MKNVRPKGRSRMANYQSSADNNDYEEKKPKLEEPDQLFNDADADQVEILFDGDNLIADFGQGHRDQAQPSFPHSNNDDLFAESPIDKSGAENNSGFLEQEIPMDSQLDSKVLQNHTTNSDATREVPEVDKGFIMQSDDSANFSKISSVNNFSQSSNAPSSYVNYQISSAMRGNKKKPLPPRNKPVVTNKKPDILGIDNDDIGEVGEWVGRSANVNVKNEDDEDEEDNNKSDDDFDAVFDNQETAPKVKTAVVSNKQKSTETKSTIKSTTNEEEGEEEAEKQQPFSMQSAISEQSNLAMQKAQGIALKAAKNRGPFMNNLKEKAKTIQTKISGEPNDLVDGDIKLKEAIQKASVEGKDKFEEKKQQITNTIKTQSKEKVSKLYENNNFQESDEQEEESPDVFGINKDPLPAFKGKKPLTLAEKASPNSEAHQNLHNNMMEDEVPQPVGEATDLQEMISPSQLPEDDWEAISKANKQQANQIENKDQIKLLKFDEVWTKVRNFSLPQQRKQVQQELQASQGLFHKLFASCSRGHLPPPLLEERDQILALAKVPFDDDEPLHFEILKTLYIKLTGKTDVPRFGLHWETIGFQGRDPATDLRGVGILGLVQLLAFITYYEGLFRKMFEHSIDKKYNFPLSICGFSMTQAVMEQLRADKLNMNIIAKKSVIEVFNEFYFATFYKLYSIYEQNSYTISEYPVAKTAAVEMLRTTKLKLLYDFTKDNNAK